jgi:hypothetical protein
MLAAYIAVTALTVIANAYAAYMDFVGDESVIATAERVRVSPSWMIPLGTLLAAGAIGLLVGFAVPVIGTAAAIGLVLYFTCAVRAHLRAHDRQFEAAAIFLSLAVAALIVGLAYHGP